jgi:oligoribonuclease
MDLEMTGLDVGRHVIVEVAPEQLAAMDDVVRGMHTKSGLLAAIEASTTSLQEAARATLDFIRAHVPEPRSVPLAGNSIGTDRRFLAAQMPEVEDYLHYRSVDVSTIKELVRRWYPEAAAAAPDKAGGHRAMDDIRESVAELAYYRGTVFRPVGGDEGAQPLPSPA